MKTYNHHIVPRHMGGSDDKSNLMEVTAEQHANLHLALYLEHGKREDWVAFHAIAGHIGKEDIIRERAIMGAKHPNVQSPEARAKRSEALRRRVRKPLTEDQKKRISEATKKAMRTPEMRKRCAEHAKRQNNPRDEKGKFVKLNN